MELPVILAGAGILLFSVVLSLGAERLMRRLNVRPANPDQRSRGIHDVFARVDGWRRSRDTRAPESSSNDPRN